MNESKEAEVTRLVVVHVCWWSKAQRPKQFFGETSIPACNDYLPRKQTPRCATPQTSTSVPTHRENLKRLQLPFFANRCYQMKQAVFCAFSVPLPHWTKTPVFPVYRTACLLVLRKKLSTKLAGYFYHIQQFLPVEIS